MTAKITREPGGSGLQEITDVKAALLAEAESEAGVTGGFGIVEGDEVGASPIGESGEGAGEAIHSTHEEEYAEPIQTGFEEEEPSAEEEMVVEPKPIEEPEPIEEGEEEEAIGEEAPPKGKDMAKHFQGLAEGRLNEMNRLKDDAAYQVGQVIAQNPALLQVFQAVKSGDVSMEQILKASTPAPEQSPLTSPVMPQQPTGYSEAEAYTEGTPSNLYQKQMTDYLLQSINFLVERDNQREGQRQQELVGQRAQMQKEANVQQLMSLHSYTEAEAKAFVDKYSQPGSMSLELLVRADRAQTLSPEEAKREAKNQEHRARQAKLKKRSPGAPVGGSGGGGEQKKKESPSEDELFSQEILDSNLYE